MKNHARILSILLALLALSTLNTQLSTLHAQGTAFTYQGQLQNNGSPANGSYNLTFSLYATNTGGTPVAGPVTNNAVAVSNGLFTVIIDFGPGVWNGQTNWLQIGVETNSAGATFTILTPRQQITPTPYAITAESIDGTVSTSQLTSIGNTNGGIGNFFIGSSGNPTNSGDNNTAIGAHALGDITTGLGNVASGGDALNDNTIGLDNTADGAAALYDNISGSFNIALGYQAGFSISTGSSNIDIGNHGLSSDTNIIRIGSGQTQTYIAGVINGNGSGLTNVSAAQLMSIGNTNGGSGNFFIGSSGNPTNSGSENTANGVQALNNNTTGYNNTANGVAALESNTSGSQNTADGGGALGLNTSGSNNIALGFLAGINITTGSSNIDIGNQGLYTDTNIVRIGSAQSQTFITGVINGDGGGLTDLNAAQLTSIGNTNGGSGNFFIGSSGNAVNSGFSNTGLGMDALSSNTNGSYNTAIGVNALNSNTSGLNNTANGVDALYDCTTGSNNIALGYYAGAFITTGNNNIDIDNTGNASDNNIIRIGGLQTATYLAGNLYVSGAVFSNGVDVVSDRNAKENFSAVNPQTVLARVAAMPVTEWNYKTDRNAEHIGPMAQDFHAAFNLNGNDDRHISVLDEGGVALAAVQGLNQKLEARSQKAEDRIQKLEAENADLRKQNDSLAQRLDELEQTVKTLAQRN
jgi:trimeric autotransporter adhesin